MQRVYTILLVLLLCALSVLSTTKTHAQQCEVVFEEEARQALADDIALALGQTQLLVGSYSPVFGGVMTDRLTYVSQLDFLSVDTIRMMNTIVFGGAIGTVGTSSTNMILLRASPTEGSLTSAYGVRGATFQSGMGMQARMTVVFDNLGDTQDDYDQWAGMFSPTDGVMVGFKGHEFGVVHRHHGVLFLFGITLTSPTTTTSVISVEVAGIPTGAFTTTAGLGLNGNAREMAAAFNAHAELGARYDCLAVQEEVVCLARVAEADPYAYDFDLSGLNTGVTGLDAFHTIPHAGKAPIEDFQARGSFSENQLDDLNPHLVNIYQVQGGYLGAADLSFYVYHNSTWVKFHRQEWHNTHDHTNFGLPKLRVGFELKCKSATCTTSGASGVELTAGSAMLAYEGIPIDSTLTDSTTNSVTTGATEVPILSLRNSLEFKGVQNIGKTILATISCVTESTTGARFALKRGCELVGEEWEYHHVLRDSIVLEDKVATQCNNGNIIETRAIGAESSETWSVLDIGAELDDPRELLTLTVVVPSGVSAANTCSVTWLEEY